jgi:hypothetical protein
MTKSPETKPQLKRICKICRESKSEDQFVVSAVGYMKKYSSICAKCREADFDDEGGSGGKQEKFAIDQDTKDAMLLDQQEEKEARELEKQEAREKFAEESIEIEEDHNEKQAEAETDDSTKEKKQTKEEKQSKQEKSQREEKSKYASGIDDVLEKNWEMAHQIITGGLAAFSYNWVNQLLNWVAHTGGAAAFTLDWIERSGTVHSGRLQSAKFHSAAAASAPPQKNETNELLQFVKESFGKYSGR